MFGALGEQVVGHQEGRHHQRHQRGQQAASRHHATVAVAAEQPVGQDAAKEFRQAQQRIAVQQAGPGDPVALAGHYQRRRDQVDQPDQRQHLPLVPAAHQPRGDEGKRQVEEHQRRQRPQRRVEGQVIGIPGLQQEDLQDAVDEQFGVAHPVQEEFRVGAAEHFVGVVDDEARGGLVQLGTDSQVAEGQQHQDRQQQGEQVQRIEIGQSLGPETAGAFAQPAAACVDMGQEEAGKHEEGTGGEEPQAGQFVETGKLLLFRIGMQGVVHHHVQAEQEAQPFQSDETFLGVGRCHASLLCHCNGRSGVDPQAPRQVSPGRPAATNGRS